MLYSRCYPERFQCGRETRVGLFPFPTDSGKCGCVVVLEETQTTLQNGIEFCYLFTLVYPAPVQSMPHSYIIINKYF